MVRAWGCRTWGATTTRRWPASSPPRRTGPASPSGRSTTSSARSTSSQAAGGCFASSQRTAQPTGRATRLITARAERWSNPITGFVRWRSGWAAWASSARRCSRSSRSTSCARCATSTPGSASGPTWRTGRFSSATATTRFCSARTSASTPIPASSLRATTRRTPGAGRSASERATGRWSSRRRFP